MKSTFRWQSHQDAWVLQNGLPGSGILKSAFSVAEDERQQGIVKQERKKSERFVRFRSQSSEAHTLPPVFVDRQLAQFWNDGDHPIVSNSVLGVLTSNHEVSGVQRLGKQSTKDGTNLFPEKRQPLMHDCVG